METKHAERLWRLEKHSDSETRGVRARVDAARHFGLESRGAGGPNSGLFGPELQAAARLAPPAQRLLIDAVERWSLSARAVHRTLRVARTISDLSGAERIDVEAVAEALSMRHEALQEPGP